MDVINVTLQTLYQCSLLAKSVVPYHFSNLLEPLLPAGQLLALKGFPKF